MPIAWVACRKIGYSKFGVTVGVFHFSQDCQRNGIVGDCIEDSGLPNSVTAIHSWLLINRRLDGVRAALSRCFFQVTPALRGPEGEKYARQCVFYRAAARFASRQA